MPPRPRLATKEASLAAPIVDAATQYETWDQLVAEAQAQANIAPYVLPLPDGDHVEIPCPTGRQMEEFGAADIKGDQMAAAVAFFGPVAAPRVLLALRDLPFFAPGKLVNKIIAYYGIPRSELGNS